MRPASAVCLTVSLLFSVLWRPTRAQEIFPFDPQLSSRTPRGLNGQPWPERNALSRLPDTQVASSSSPGLDFAASPGITPAEPPIPNLLGQGWLSTQDEIETNWRGFLPRCLRAFDFEDNCDDQFGHENFAVTDLTFAESRSGFGRAANFSLPGAELNLGCPTDIANVHTFTYACWVRPTKNDTQVVFTKGNLKTFWLTTQGSGLRLRGRVACAAVQAVSESTPALDVNEWHHVAMSYNAGGKVVRLYLDGSEVSYAKQQPGQGPETDDGAKHARVGTTGTHSLFVLEGYLDAFRWYGTELTPARVFDLYSNGDLVAACREKRVTASRPMVSFTFDDGYATDHDVMLPLFRSKGVAATSYVVTDWIGAPNRLTREQLIEMKKAGWEIGSHTKTHPEILTLSEAAVDAELSGSLLALKRIGINAATFAYPRGDQNETIRRLVKNYYEGARVANHPNHTSTMDAYLLKAHQADDPASLDLHRRKVDDAARDCLWLILYLHRTEDSDAAMVNNLLDYLHEKAIPVVTVADGLSSCEKGLSYRGNYLRCSATSSPRAFYRVVTLQEATHVVSFLAYTNGSEINSSHVIPYASRASQNAVGNVRYEHRGRGIYFCRGTFAADAGEWKVGVEIQPGIVADIVQLACYPLQASGVWLRLSGGVAAE